ncbi:MAG TPA: FtsX-like permease family protein [Solirubrobacteraceae bacterium]|nr:FtsX-like permease family protein [Solirubrobacteraceae bacterium]
MGRLLLLARLVVGDIKRRRLQSGLLLAMIAATTATLTLALALHGVTNDPFARTRAATRGPDVSGLFEPGFHGNAGTLAQFVALRRARGVVGASGPYPVTRIELSWRGAHVRTHAEGRDTDRSAIDRPLLTAGRWTAPGGVVIERSFADALGLHIGDTVSLNGRRFAVRGIAVTSAVATSDPLIWLTERDLIALAGEHPSLWYALNLKLADPAGAPAFANAHAGGPDTAWALESWQAVRADDSQTIFDEQQLLEVGSALLVLISIAGIAVLVGGRMAEQTRRVGLLKAVGATPGGIAVVLLAENVLLALAGTVVGVATGWLLAPVITQPGASLLGSAGSPALAPGSVVLAVGVAIAVATAATIGPALRGARTSTIRALNDPARPPQRRPRLIALSSHLGGAGLLAVRLIARRPRRTLLGIVSVTIAVATVIATLIERHAPVLGMRVAGNVLAASRQTSLDHVGNVLSAILLAVAAVNLVFATWATVLDARRPTALARALGATPNQVTTGLAGAQLAPALIAAILGIPAGLVVFAVAGGNPLRANPPVLWLIAVIPATLIAVAALTAIPARIGAERPVAEVLRSE